MTRFLLPALLVLLPLSIQAQSIQLGPEVEPGTPVDVRDGDDVFMTHSNDLTVTHNGLRCIYDGGASTADNNYWRVFHLPDFGIEGNLEVSVLMLGIGTNNAVNDQNLFFYLLDGDLHWDNLDIHDFYILTVDPDDTGEVLTIDLDEPFTVPAGATLAVQLNIPDSGGDHVASAGFNLEGETDPTYWHSEACSFPDPVDMTGIGGAPEELAWVFAIIGKDIVLDGEEGVTARNVTLGGAYPNPMTGQATLPITLEESSHVRISVHDVMGREVSVAFDDVMQAGQQSVNINTGNLASGTYVVRMIAGSDVLSSRIVVVR